MDIILFIMSNYIFIGFFRLFFGLLGVYYGFKFIKLYKHAKSFIKSQGEIVKIWIDNPKTVGSTPRSNKCLYINYTYNFENKSYQSNILYSGELKNVAATTIMNIKEAEKIVNNLKNDFKVYINPKNPEESFVLFTSNFLIYSLITICPILIMLGLCFIIMGV